MVKSTTITATNEISLNPADIATTTFTYYGTRVYCDPRSKRFETERHHADFFVKVIQEMVINRRNFVCNDAGKSIVK